MSYFDYKTRQIDRLEDNFPRELSDEERKKDDQKSSVLYY